LSDRPLLLFDEATPALDHATEVALQRSLEVATAGRTTVIVTHRLSMSRHADGIYGAPLIRPPDTLSGTAFSRTDAIDYSAILPLVLFLGSLAWSSLAGRDGTGGVYSRTGVPV